MRPRVAAPGEEALLDLLSLDDALTRLAAYDERKAKMIELRYFAGLESKDVAEMYDVDVRTVQRDVKYALAWLKREMLGRTHEDHPSS